MIADLRTRARALGTEVAAGLEELGTEEAALGALKALAGAGLAAYTVPERDGGASTGELSPAESVSVRALCALRDELAYHSGMLDVMFVMQGLGSYSVALGGNEELRRDVLPDVAAGEAIAAFALTEPEAGSSLADIATRAERKGDGWVLSGRPPDKTGWRLQNVQLPPRCCPSTLRAVLEAYRRGARSEACRDAAVTRYGSWQLRRHPVPAETWRWKPEQRR